MAQYTIKFSELKGIFSAMNGFYVPETLALCLFTMSYVGTSTHSKKQFFEYCGSLRSSKRQHEANRSSLGRSIYTSFSRKENLEGCIYNFVIRARLGKEANNEDVLERLIFV